MGYTLLFYILILSLTNSAMARSISYPGGWTIMQTNDWESSRLHTHYSFNIKNSIGVALENYNELDRYSVNLQWNYLLGRKNTKNSQANLYLKTLGGVAFEGDEKEPNFSVGIAGDWETRRYFVSYEAMVRYVDKLDGGSFNQKSRVGVTPYVGEYGDIHTWIMLQAEHHPEEIDQNDQIIFTPMVRIFKDDYLGEFGVNTNGDAMFSWIMRF